EWCAVADAFGHRYQIGRHSPVFKTPELRSRAAKARLHFVGDTQSAVAADDVVNDAKILRRRCDCSADALDRLGNEAGDLAARFVLDHVLYIVSTLHPAAWVFQSVGAT